MGINKFLTEKIIKTDSNLYMAYQSGAAGGLSFILCASRDNASGYGASVGRGFSEDIISDAIEGILGQQKPELTSKLKSLLAEEKERVGREKANAKFANLWIDHIGMLRLAESLQSGGASVRTLYWDVDAVVKELGVGSVNIVSAVLGNSEAEESYGSVVDDSIRGIMQKLISKFIAMEKPALYSNEVDGIGAIGWNTYPSILAVRQNEVELQTVEETLAEAKALLQL